jgi:hypothetical protein
MERFKRPHEEKGNEMEVYRNTSYWKVEMSPGSTVLN